MMIKVINVLKWFFRRFIQPTWIVLKDTIEAYQRDKVMPLGAAVAYYTIFSLPAIIIIMVGLVGFFFGEAAVRGEIYENLIDLLGKDAALQVQNAVKGIGGTARDNWWATVLGIGFLIFIASGVFYALQDSLNQIFRVEELKGKMKFLRMVVDRLLSFGMMLSVGGLLMASILSNTILLQVTTFVTKNNKKIISELPQKWKWLSHYLNYFTDYFLVFLNLGISIFLLSLFFALLYKILPAVQLKWPYVWRGSIFAAILFWIGQMLMGYYLSHTNVISAYGAAGSIIVILIWVYYSSQLIFIGAEFIKALYRYRGLTIYPKPFARNLPRKSLEEENLETELNPNT